MASDGLVAPRDVLQAIQEVRRLGIDRLLKEWEAREPDLTEHLLEGVSELHRQLAKIAPHPKAERRLLKQTEVLILVLLTAMRRALLRQWQSDENEGPSGRQSAPRTDLASHEDDENGGDANAS